MAIQLVKLREAQIATTISSQNQARFTDHLGADHCTYDNRMDFVQAVMTWTDHRGVDIAFDTVGQSVLAENFKAVKYGGNVGARLVPADTTTWKTARDRNLKISLNSCCPLNLNKSLKHAAIKPRFWPAVRNI